MSFSSASAPPPDREPAAVIGLGCLFPGRPGVAGYWSVVKNGLDTMSGIPSDRFNAGDYYDPDPKARDRIYVKRGAFLARVPFEPLRYGISPKDMESIDSTQLLGLLAADAALADAGCPADRHDHSRTAVILGVTGALKMTVTLGQRLAHPQLRKALAGAGVDKETAQEVIERFAEQFAPWRELSFPGLLGNVTAGRIASRLNLGGANMAVDAACASSLAAVSQAILELRSGRADLVVSGGVDTFSDPFMFCCFSKTPALSRAGEVRSFDEAGDGTMLGEGLGVVVLKRLSDARRDGNRVYAVIKAVGAASDGRGTAIFAPSPQGQKRAIEAAYREAGWTPDTVELVEAHGTGTAVGDAAELEALSEFFSQAFPQETQDPQDGRAVSGSPESQSPQASPVPPTQPASPEGLSPQAAPGSSEASEGQRADGPSEAANPDREAPGSPQEALPAPDPGALSSGEPSASPDAEDAAAADNASEAQAAAGGSPEAEDAGSAPEAEDAGSAPETEGASNSGGAPEPQAASGAPAPPGAGRPAGLSEGPWCALGSVKSQIGHTKAAAGAAGLIKAVLALHHKVLPPTIKVKRPLAPLREESCPFYVNTEARPWFASGSHPRRAGVSAFGFGGSNFHCLLEEAGEIKMPFETGVHLLPFSGQSMPELIKGIQDLAEEAWLSVPSESLENERHAADYFSQAVDYHLRPRLSSFSQNDPERIFLAFPALRARDYLSSLPEILREHGLKTEIFSLPDGLFFGVKDPGKAPELTYFAPGSFRLAPGTGQDLALHFPHFQMILDLFAGSRAGTPLGQLLYPPELAPAGLRESWARELSDPSAGYFLKPALAIALHELYSFFGVKAARAAGEGPGLVAALVISGWLPLKEAVRALGEVPCGDTDALRRAVLSLPAEKPSAGGFPELFRADGRPFATAGEVKDALEGDLDLYLRDPEGFGAPELLPLFPDDLILYAGSSGSLFGGGPDRFCDGRILPAPDGALDFAKNLARLAAAGESVSFRNWSYFTFPPPKPGGHHVLLSGANTFRPQNLMPPRSPRESPSGPSAGDLAARVTELADLQSQTLERLASLEGALRAGTSPCGEAFPASAAGTAPYARGPAEAGPYAREFFGSRPSVQGPAEDTPYVPAPPDLGPYSVILGSAAPRPRSEATADSWPSVPVGRNYSLPVQGGLPVAPPRQASPAPAASRPPSGGNGRRPGSEDSAWRRLCETVSRQTGYPPDSLKPFMDLENDLGLDSIKKVELLSEVAGMAPGREELLKRAGGTLGELAQALEGFESLQGMHGQEEFQGLQARGRSGFTAGPAEPGPLDGAGEPGTKAAGPYGPQETGSQAWKPFGGDLPGPNEPYRPQAPYALQDPNAGGNPYRPQDPNTGGNPYRPQDPYSGGNPYRPQDPYAGGDPYRPQDPHAEGDPYRPQDPHAG
ncbi:MAG: hypothetical protein LBW85_07320, partial [Deltaproteobacteria bacterium]|nr:hypothetical protein [Deltaproteobacteria bacterium]